MTPGNKGGIELSAVKCRPMRCPFPEDTLRGMVEFSGLSIGSMARSDWNLKTQFWKTNYFVWILNKFSSITNQASTPHSPNILFCHMFSKNISLDYFFSNSRRIFIYLDVMRHHSCDKDQISKILFFFCCSQLENSLKYQIFEIVNKTLVLNSLL